jgi:hypothetical protein
MSINEAVREWFLFIFLRHTREETWKGRRGKCIPEGQQTGVIGVKPTVKMQSASVAPGIATAPPSVGQVPMTDDVPTGSATVSVDVSILPAR